MLLLVCINATANISGNTINAKTIITFQLLSVYYYFSVFLGQYSLKYKFNSVKK